MVVIVAKFIGNGSETLIQGTEYSTLGGVAELVGHRLNLSGPLMFQSSFTSPPLDPTVSMEAIVYYVSVAGNRHDKINIEQRITQLETKVDQAIVQFMNAFTTLQDSLTTIQRTLDAPKPGLLDRLFPKSYKYKKL